MTEKQHTPILTGLRTIETDRDWEVEVVSLVVGIFGIGKEDGKKIIHELDYRLLNDMRNFSESTGGIHSVPPVSCWTCWGKTYRSVSPSLPRGVRGWGVIEHRGYSRRETLVIL